jgi:hypothetical protein
MRIVLLSPDLLIGSRIAAIADSAGAAIRRVDGPASLPPPYQVDRWTIPTRDAEVNPAWARVALLYARRLPIAELLAQHQERRISAR